MISCIGMGVGIDAANRDVRNSTHPNRKHIDANGNEIHRLEGRRSLIPGTSGASSHVTF
jgi:hypothetical protein